MEGSQSKNHEDHIAGQGMNLLSHYNLVYKFIPMLDAMKIPDAKAAVDKENGKIRENTGMVSDTWTGVTRFIVLNERHLMEKHGPGGDDIKT